MSTDFGFLCRDCGTTMRMENCRQPEVVRSMLAHLPALATVVALGCDVGYPGWYCVASAIQLAREHMDAGHVVVVGDEYGREWDQCHDDATCPTCKHRAPCTKKQGHAGACGTFEPLGESIGNPDE